jgi:hypothetical protein
LNHGILWINHIQRYSESCTDETEQYKRSSHFQHLCVSGSFYVLMRD